jgi:glutamyl-tRNA synthetase
MSKKVRVRFAPSPTGGLHLGGVRTVLFNYLFAKQHGGDFIVRIEDTDQTRFVEGAEQYIFDTLKWCGLEPDESPLHGGPHAPYRQSERKASYRQYAEQLVQQGNAYYAFDTTEQLEEMRIKFKTEKNPSPWYDHIIRMNMRNSLTLPKEETERLLSENAPHVIRIKIPSEQSKVIVPDMIRGDVEFFTQWIDDKVLLKSDGMPTYHLAVVVDDYLMKITHAFRGEEWLLSAPVHVLLWQYLFGLENMPQWAHLPLILKPDGNGKLSKRDGDRLGFPVFAMDWNNADGTVNSGFRERGFLPEAFVNMLAMLGWNPGVEQEIFSLEELVEKFSIERVHKGGAKFDFEKAKWYNGEWIKKLPVSSYQLQVVRLLTEQGIDITDEKKLTKVIEMVKDRCTLLNDFVQQASFFFKLPETIDIAAIKPKWDEKKNMFFIEAIRMFEQSALWEATDLEASFKELAAANELKPGELMLPLRIMLVGGKFGPGVFDIAAIIGKEETVKRIEYTVSLLK